MNTLHTPDWLSFFASDFSDYFPKNWKTQISNIVQAEANGILLDGNSATSRELPGTKIPVKVVEGHAIKLKLPWLVSLYDNEFLKFSANNFNKDLFKCNEANDAININCIEGASARYEWHVDTNPVTGILFVDSFSEAEGGALTFRNRGEVFRFYPKSGWFCCFAAQDVEHSVEPLLSTSRRISIPMNYYDDPHNTGRDPLLNVYLAKKQ